MSQVFSDVLVGTAVPGEDGSLSVRTGDEQRDVSNVPLSQVVPWMLGMLPSDSGVVVTPEVAMTATVVHACVSVISSAMASLPVKVLGRKDLREDAEHPVSWLLGNEPNEYCTAADATECMMVNLLLWGNCYAFIEKDSRGVPSQLLPLKAASTRPIRVNGELIYRTVIDTQSFDLRPDQIFHVKDISIETVFGLSRIASGTNAIGLTLAMERYGSKFFSNGGNAGGFIELPAGMKKEQIENFIRTWKQNYVGLDNSLKTGLLTDGMRYTRTAIDPRNAQMIDTRLFQILEVCRLYRVPPHKVGELTRATFSNIEHQSIEFMQDCVRPWAIKWEQEANRKLLLEREKRRVEVKFNLDSLLRADTLSRYQAHNLALQGGWKTRNEVRAEEGMPPIEGGDTPLQPLNMGPAGEQPKEPENKKETQAETQGGKSEKEAEEEEGEE